MALFDAGDRVKIPENERRAPHDWRGKSGKVIRWFGNVSIGTRPITVELPPMEWEESYIVQFDNEDTPRLIAQSWLTDE